jgi:hypothetical protein
MLDLRRRQFITLLGGALLHGHLSRRIFMRRLLTEVEKAEVIEREWAKARAKNPKIVMRVTVQDETDEGGKPRVNVVIASLKRGC